MGVNLKVNEGKRGTGSKTGIETASLNRGGPISTRLGSVFGQVNKQYHKKSLGQGGARKK